MTASPDASKTVSATNGGKLGTELGDLREAEGRERTPEPEADTEVETDSDIVISAEGVADWAPGGPGLTTPPLGENG